MSIDNEKILNSLNTSQKEAVITTEGPLLILAGAGTGKTHTMVSRLAYLVNNGVHPKRILMLTFTNSAANEMKKRATQMAGEKCKDITACTYHSFCNILLRKYGDAIGLDRDFSILSTSQAEEAIRFVKSSSVFLTNIKDFPSPEQLLKFHSASINKDIKIKKIIKESRFSVYVNEIIEVLKLYDTYKKEKNFLDFDDLLIYANRLLEESEEIRSKVEKTYQYVMVDEYQDSNDLQTKLLTLLRKDNKNLAVIGDDAQSIYSFRGANIENIRNFPNKFKNCRIIKLTENYRSTQKILDLANKSYESNTTEGFSKTMHAQTEGTIKPVLFRPYSDAYGDNQIVEEIKRLHKEENVPYEEIAILGRFSRMFFLIEANLVKAGIEYEKYGGRKFFDFPCVLDIIAFIRVIQNPKDDLSFFRILALIPGIGEVTARKIARECKNNDFLIDKKYKERKYYNYLSSLHNFIKGLREASKYNTEEIFNKAYDFYINLRIETIKIGKYQNEENRKNAYEKIDKDKEVLESLKELVLQYNSINSFLDSLILKQTEKKETKNKVIISTIHSAKGLEFNTVFVVKCVEGEFPTSDTKIDKKSFNEELRCFYVAITRAKERLYIVAEKFNIYRGEHFEITSFLKDCKPYYSQVDNLVINSESLNKLKLDGEIYNKRKKEGYRRLSYEEVNNNSYKETSILNILIGNIKKIFKKRA